MEKVDKTELRVIDALTEKLVVKQAVREALKTQVENEYLADFEKQQDNSYTLDLVQDTTGKVLKAKITMTITTATDFAKKGSKKKTEVVVPDLF